MLSVYKDEGGAATEKTTAETYFDLDVDHDSISGWHNVRLDLSGDVFFATGADYSIVITTGTVDSVNVFGENIANFSIENRSMGQPAGATLADDISDIKSELVVISDAVLVIDDFLDTEMAAQTSNLVIIASDTVVLESDSITVQSSLVVVESQTTVLESDSITIQSSLVVVESQTTVIESDSIIVESSVQVTESDVILVLSDTSDTLSNLVVVASQVLLTQSEVSQILSDTTVIESDTTVIESDVILALSDTSDVLSILNDATIGLNALETIVSDTRSALLLVESEVSNILSDTIVIESSVQVTESDVILVLSDTSDVLSILTDATIGLAALETIVSDTESNVVVVAADVLITQSEVSNILSDTTRLELGLVVATGALEGTPTVSDMTTDLAETTDDHYNDMTVVMTSGNEAGQSRRITNYTGATGNIEVSPDWTGAAPSATETFAILPVIEGGGSLTATQDSRLTRVQSDAIQIYSDTSILVTDSTQIKSDVVRLELSHVIATGTVENSGSNSATQVQTTLSESTDNHYNNNVTILFTSGAEAGQARVIDDYDGALGIVSWTEALTDTPADSVTFSLVPSSSVIATLATGAIKASTFAAGALDAAALAADAVLEIADGVWDEPTVGHLTASTFGVQCGTDLDSILSDTTVLGDDLVLVKSDASDILSRLVVVHSETTAIQADAVVIRSDTTAINLQTTTIASDVVVLDTNLTTVDDLIDTEIGNIQDRLPAALVSGRMSADMVAISGSTTVADLIELSGGQIIVLTVDSGAFTPTTTEFEADDITETDNDHFNGRNIYWTTGPLAGQATDITDYTLTGANGHFTVTALTEAPGNNDTGVIV